MFFGVHAAAGLARVEGDELVFLVHCGVYGCYVGFHGIGAVHYLSVLWNRGWYVYMHMWRRFCVHEADGICAQSNASHLRWGATKHSVLRHWSLFLTFCQI